MAVDQISIDRLNQLHPAIRAKAIAAYTEACAVTPAGVHPVITETYRSFERSDELYAQGRTKPGQIVTNAKGGQSMHNYKLAIDFTLTVNGKTSWIVDANWMKVVKAFKDKGFVWGGDWSKFKDYPHFEMTLGNSLKQLQDRYKSKDFIPGTDFLKL